MAFEGLTAAEAAARLADHGPNVLEVEDRDSVLRRVSVQFRNPLIIVLLIASVVTAAVGDIVDSIIILAVVVINAVIGWVQEGRAQRALQAVRALLVSSATVIRDGYRQRIDARTIVPGDVVVIEAGDRIAADMRLLRSHAVRVEESVLTGESVPIEKSAENADSVSAGTLVVAGSGIGEVTATGVDTAMGRIGQLLAEESAVTPLTRRLDRFAWQITWAIIIVGALAWMFAVLARGYDAVDAFLAVIGLAVAAIPEGLPAIISIVLAIGTAAMARQKAIIRRLPSVETLGSVDVICTDKTGTLTRNEMTVVSVMLPECDAHVDGVGYEPRGRVTRAGESLSETQLGQLNDLALAGLLCNDAHLVEDESGWHVMGDPTEGALIPLAHKVGLDVESVVSEWELLDQIPFDPEYRFMATLRRSTDGRVMVFVKGAPEVLLSMTDEADDWVHRIHRAADQGRRVLALASTEMPADTVVIDRPISRTPLRLRGMVELIDPPRIEAAEAIKECHRAGIRVVMITGDHTVTAAAIGRELGLRADHALRGSSVAQSSDEVVRAEFADTDVIARASPEVKMRLVRLLQEDGLSVAMTGDGVNDAPALRRADIGVAMGQRGTDAARDSSDLILTDDNFATIAAAVRQGRAVYDNIIKALQFILPTNGGEAGLILLAIALGITLPVTVGQILWVNLVTTVTLALAFAFEPPEPDVMRGRPSQSGAGIVTRRVLIRILAVSVVMIGVILASFEFGVRNSGSVDEARTMAVTMIVLAEILYLFNVRNLSRSSLTWRVFTGNRVALIAVIVLIGLQLAFIYLPPMQAAFDTTPLSLPEWGVLLALGVVFFLVIETVKFVERRHERVRG